MYTTIPGKATKLHRLGRFSVRKVRAGYSLYEGREKIGEFEERAEALQELRWHYNNGLRETIDGLLADRDDYEASTSRRLEAVVMALKAGL